MGRSVDWARRNIGRARPAVWLAVVGMAAVLVGSWLWPVGNIGDRWIDVQVYRGAVEWMLGGHDLYDFAIPDVNGPVTFLYPPFAALLAVPATWLSLGSEITAWTVFQLAMSGLLVWLLLREASGAARPARRSLLVPVAAWALLAFSRPVLMGFNLGQVSLFVTALVVADVLLLPPKWRGVLVGIAGAIKLTPLFLIAFFLASRQRRAAATAAATFLAAAVAGFVALPAESVSYWTRIVFDSTRVPSFGSQRNLSLLGTMTFWGAPEQWVRLLWLALGLAVALVCLWRASRHHARGEEAAALIVAGMATTVLSPVAWDHFYVWLPLAGLYMTMSQPAWARRAGWALLIATSFVSPIWPTETTPAGLAPLGLVPLMLALAVMVAGLPRREACGMQGDPEPQLRGSEPSQMGTVRQPECSDIETEEGQLGAVPARPGAAP